jgi:DNA topoisomerase IA
MKILMVAEMPAIAQAIAEAMSNGRHESRRGTTPVHEFSGQFRGQHAFFKVTSVIGHVYRCAFLPLREVPQNFSFSFFAGKRFFISESCAKILKECSIIINFTIFWKRPQKLFFFSFHASSKSCTKFLVSSANI